MKIRDVGVEQITEGRVWRLVDSASPQMIDWQIETAAGFDEEDTVIYSALAVFPTGEVRPLLLVREVGTYEWWGDTCEYVDGAWRELQRGAGDWNAETYVAAPLANDPSFMGAYSHEQQREGFARWCHGLRAAPARRDA